MIHGPIDDVTNAMTFCAALGLDVRYFAGANQYTQTI